MSNQNNRHSVRLTIPAHELCQTIIYARTSQLLGIASIVAKMGCIWGDGDHYSAVFDCEKIREAFWRCVWNRNIKCPRTRKELSSAIDSLAKMEEQMNARISVANKKRCL